MSKKYVDEIDCEKCNARLIVTAGNNSVACPACAHENQVEASNLRRYLRGDELERRFTEEIENTVTEQPETVSCEICKAEIIPDEITKTCGFCAAPLSAVPRTSARERVAPQYYLPSLIDREKATANFRRWIRSLWFLPTSVKRNTKNIELMSSVYLPFWKYDVETRTEYKGQRGYGSEHTRWSDRSGTIHSTFKEILISGTTSVLKEKLDQLDPWDLQELKKYKGSLPEGSSRELYNIDPKKAFREAKIRMDLSITSQILKLIGGDNQRVTSTKTKYHNMSFTHILLPVWVAGYQHKQKTYQFLVNARSGEVQGERPWSEIKIWLACFAGFSILFGAFLYYTNQP